MDRGEGDKMAFFNSRYTQAAAASGLASERTGLLDVLSTMDGKGGEALGEVAFSTNGLVYLSLDMVVG